MYKSIHNFSTERMYFVTYIVTAYSDGKCFFPGHIDTLCLIKGGNMVLQPSLCL